MPIDRFDDLVVFLSVADAGSISGGARSLGMDPSTVSRRLTRLEESLEKTLFLRSGSGMLLSEAGERLLPRIREAVHAVKLGIDEATRPPDGLHGAIRLTAPTEIGTAFILPSLIDFRAAHPGVTVEMELGAHVVDLERAAADIAVRTFRPTTGDLVTRRLGATPVAPFHAPHISAQEARLHWVDFTAEGEDIANYVSTLPGARIVFRSNDLAGLRAAAVSGLGTAFLPVLLGEHLGLKQLAEPPAVMGPALFMASPKTSLERPRVRALWDHILAGFDDLPQ